MKVKNGDIYIAQEPLRALSAIKLPVMVSYELAKLRQLVNKEYDPINEAKNALVRSYGKKQDDGTYLLTQADEEWDTYALEYNKLMNHEVSLDIQKVKIPAEYDGKRVEIEANVILPLLEFVEVVN